MIYLDHAATSLPRLPAALDAATRAFALGNPGRGASRASLEATRAVEVARDEVRAMVGWGTVCFTAGATDALNIALRGWRPVPACVAVDPMAHNAVSRTLAAMGVATWTLPHDRNGVVQPSEIEGEWRSGTSLVLVTHASNVTGAVQPLGAIAHVATRLGAAVIVDAAQTAGLLPLDVDGVSALAFGAHKALRALPGVGALVVRSDGVFEPVRTGGTGGDSASESMPAELPWRLEAGTPNVPGIVAMGVAASTVSIDASRVRESSEKLRDAVERADVTVYGARSDVPVVSFDVPGIAPGEVADMLDRAFDIVTRAGLHCAPSAHRTLGTIERGTVRVSSGGNTTDEDLAVLTRALRDISGARAPRRHG